MMKRYLMIAMVIGCILVGCVACSMPGDAGANSSKNTPSQSVTNNASTTATPIVQPTLSAASVQSIPAVMNYYQAIKQKDYAKAFSYVDANATTTDGKKLTEDTLTQLARSQDANYGPISNVEMEPDAKDGTQVTATIDRGSGLHYHAQLTLKKEGNEWKVISLDRI